MLHDQMRQGSGMGKSLQLINLIFAVDQRRQRKSRREGASGLILSILPIIFRTGHWLNRLKIAGVELYNSAVN